VEELVTEIIDVLKSVALWNQASDHELNSNSEAQTLAAPSKLAAVTHLLGEKMGNGEMLVLKGAMVTNLWPVDDINVRGALQVEHKSSALRRLSDVLAAALTGGVPKRAPSSYSTKR
jgi:hypothetical protein